MALLLANRRRVVAVKHRAVSANRRREVMALAVAAVAMVAALAYARDNASTGTAAKPAAIADQGWTGQLASVAPAWIAPTEPLSSAALVVPKSKMALPPPPPKPVLHVKAVCDSADTTCVTRASLAPADASGAKRRAPSDGVARDAAAAKAKSTTRADGGFLGNLNPLAHLPDMASLGRPFASAGRAVAGWMKWF